MTSERKLLTWSEMIAAQDSVIQIPLGVEKGSQWETKPPYPDLEAIAVKEKHVRRLVMQDITMMASMSETGEEGLIRVVRLVAELEGGEEIELSKSATPISSDEPAEPDYKCRACGAMIVDDSECIIHEGKPYHRRCMS